MALIASSPLGAVATKVWRSCMIVRIFAPPPAPPPPVKKGLGPLGWILIGCGGIASGADAYAKIRAGAALVQLYSALVFHGPSLVGSIKRDLAARLRADGFACLRDAVGADQPSGQH